ncbi:MAG: head GIN domain-containing protein [Bacteroidota bacterium]|nr:head GIN domain-containing protein [Bacteroidota bacterium]
MKTKRLLLPALIAVLLCFCISCFSEWNGISGKGSLATETRNVKNFTSIELQTAANVEIVKGNAFSVNVSDYKNLLQYLKVEVVDNRLIIKRQPFSVNLSNSKAKVIITMPDPLYSLKLSGSGNIKVRSAFTDMQSLVLSGSGNVEFDGDCKLNKLDVKISGSGNIAASGSVQNLYVKISGSGNLLFSQLKAKNGNCAISGSGNMHVMIENKLEASVSGSGDIIYSGNPSVKSNVSGSGHVKHQ